MDEPTSGLDPNQIREVRQTIRSIGESKTILLSTHILQEVEAVADRVIFIHEGRVVCDEDIDTFKRRGEMDRTFAELTSV
jgi:ABC-2 type transport system ATP-binding protein